MGTLTSIKHPFVTAGLDVYFNEGEMSSPRRTPLVHHKPLGHSLPYL